jgi:hypothetical protein
LLVFVLLKHRVQIIIIVVFVIFHRRAHSAIDRWVVNKDRETGYDYRVPYSWQGRFSCIKAIGDKKGSTTALELYIGAIVLSLVHYCFSLTLATLRL